MDGYQFDELTRMWAGGLSRRRMIKVLAGGSLGALAAALGVSQAVAKPPQNKPNPGKCKAPGQNCAQDAQCCSGTCCGRQCCADGEVCDGNGQCVPAETPPNCPPPDGCCLPDGEVCDTDADCCGGACMSLCDNCDAFCTSTGSPSSCPPVEECCRPIGGTCTSDAQCCDGTCVSVCDDCPGTCR